MLPDPKTYLPKSVYRLMWTISYFLAGLIFNHPYPISLCAYYYHRQWRFAVTCTDFFLGKRHCQRAYRYYLAERSNYA